MITKTNSSNNNKKISLSNEIENNFSSSSIKKLKNKFVCQEHSNSIDDDINLIVRLKQNEMQMKIRHTKISVRKRKSSSIISVINLGSSLNFSCLFSSFITLTILLLLQLTTIRWNQQAEGELNSFIYFSQ